MHVASRQRKASIAATEQHLHCSVVYCSLSQCLLTVQEIYVYAYGFTLEKGIKCLPQEVAIEMWRLLFSAHPWPLLESWYVLAPDTAPLSQHTAVRGMLHVCS
jgi:hypothetical protein